MAITLGEVKTKIIDLIGDTLAVDELYGNPILPIRGGQTSASILLSSVEAALDAIASRIWKPSVFEVEGGVSSFDLPEDLIDIEGVKDLTTGELLPQIALQVGAAYRNGWLLYPAKKITFANPLGLSGASIYYSAVWAKPRVDAYVLEIDDVPLDAPIALTTAITFYATSYCLIERANEAAVLRQYNTKVDSGTPIDNPLKEMSDTLLQRFDIEMKRFPQKQKGATS